MSEIEVIKQKVSIVELAALQGAEPYGNGNIMHCKYNPLRDEKTCSLKLYPDTNTYCDFGDKSGTVIDFYMKATGKDIKESINDLKDFANIPKADYKPKIIARNKDYMTPEAINNAIENNSFWTNINLRNKDTLEHLKTVTPQYVLKEADKEDIKTFLSLGKWSKNRKTTVYKFPDKNGVFHTFKYRYFFNEDKNKLIKWYSQPNSFSSYLYCHLTDINKKTLIVEGSRDFLNAILLGFDVIAPYGKNYKWKDEDFDLVKDRDCIFMDDLGETVIKDFYDKADCKSKTYFNHSKMNLEECKDLSDYLYHFKSLKDFKDKFLEVSKDNGTWKDGLSNLKSILTKEALENAPKVEQLIDGFIFKGTLSVIHSRPGQGKTSLLLGLIKKMVIDNKIENFIYFDADNPMSVLKHRISKLTDTFGDKMIYHTHTMSGVPELRSEMERLCMFKGQGRNTFIVVDTVGRFVDVMKDDEVRPFMNLGMQLRDQFGATVCFVHHSNKAKDEKDNVTYRGSTVLHGDSDYMWGLQRQGDKITIKNDKGRLEYFEKIEASVSMDTYDIELEGSYEFEEYEESNEDEDTTQEINIESYLQGKDWVRISEAQKHFKMHRKAKDRETFWDMLKENKNIKLEKGENGKGWKCKLLSAAPTVIEYEAELPDCLL